MPVIRGLAKRRGAVLGAALLSVAALTATLDAAPAGAILLPAADAPVVPILGQVALRYNVDPDGAAGVATLHGVRRIPGGTVIYYSLAFSVPVDDSHYFLYLDHDSQTFSRAGNTTPHAHNMLVDPAGKKAYTALIVPSGRRDGNRSICICSDNEGIGMNHQGQANVVYQVVAALPDSVAFVDVHFSGQVIGHVKVEDGVMTPEVDSRKPIVLGMGWPRINREDLALAVEPAKSVFDVTTSVADLQQTVTTRATPKQVSVALDADVLFATDSAILSSKAQAVLSRAAADVKAAGGNGALQVIGYTDNTGSTGHNVDLSRRRAAAVAAAIQPLLGAGVQLSTSGKGEADPLATNKTTGGRALNRRVSIVFAPQGGAK